MGFNIKIMKLLFILAALFLFVVFVKKAEQIRQKERNIYKNSFKRLNNV